MSHIRPVTLAKPQTAATKGGKPYLPVVGCPVYKDELGKCDIDFR